MSLRRIDLRFALPHEVRRAAAIGLEDWSTGLEEAGVELSAAGDLDLAVAPVERANEVLGLGARAVVLEGRGGAGKLRNAGYAPSRYLPLPTIESPDLLLPLEHGEPIRYALTTWRPAETWPKQVRNRALATLARLAPDPRPLLHRAAIRSRVPGSSNRRAWRSVCLRVSSRRRRPSNRARRRTE